MKAISLWQPWASLMACGTKKNETRGWSTAYRGPLAICAAKRKPDELEIPEPLMGVIWDRFGMDCDERFEQVLERLPLGCVLAVVQLTGCVSTTGFAPCDSVELMCGNYGPGRFAWTTDDGRRCRTPVPVVGRQGMWNLPPDVEAAVLREVSL